VHLSDVHDESQLWGIAPRHMQISETTQVGPEPGTEVLSRQIGTMFEPLHYLLT
jgi:hypothetical protein